MAVDPIGLTGFILGLPGVLTSCADLYQLSVAWRDFDAESHTLYTLFSIEQTRFTTWAAQFVRENENLSAIQQGAVTNGSVLSLTALTLRSVQDTLQRLESLVAKFCGSEVSEPAANSEAIAQKDLERRLQDLAKWNQAPEPQLKSPGQDAKRKIPSAGFAKKAKWSASGREKFRDLVDDLRNLNDGLDFIGTQKHVSPIDKICPQILISTNGQDSLETLANEASARYPALALCARFKAEMLTYAGRENNPGATSYLEENSLLLPRHRLSFPPRWALRCALGVGLGQLNMPYGGSSPVITEPKRYGKDQDEGYEKFIRARVEALSRLLAKTPKPDAFCLLDCVGYVQDLPRHCFLLIHKIPPQYDDKTPPVSLSSLFSAPGTPTPPLGLRFRLAFSLANALLHLQACGVLHKGFTSLSILFFRFHSTSQLDLARPFVTGFEYSRYRGEKFISEHDETPGDEERMYVHPRYDSTRNQRFLHVFDIYSLGIVLVEIALWKPLRGLVAGMKTLSRDEMRKRLIREVLPALPASCGEVYTAVVARCLTGALGAQGGWGEIIGEGLEEGEQGSVLEEAGEEVEYLQRLFLGNVVEVLNSCYA